MRAPDAAPNHPIVPFYDGAGYEVNCIVMGRNTLTTKIEAFEAATRQVSESFADRRAVQLKLSAEALDKAAGEIEQTARQMKILSAHLAKITAAHLAREAKVRA